MQPSILLASASPDGNLEAIVEQDDRCVYLYIRPLDENLDVGLRSCWVRNLLAAPRSIEMADMERGLPPLLPAAACAHPSGAPPLREEGLRIVWLEEGDGAAVLDGDEMLAVIPGLGECNGADGRARDCVAPTPLALPLEPGDPVSARVDRADACWREWREGDPWKRVRDVGVRAITAVFGKEKKYYAIDGGRWPPQALIRCEARGASILVTLGMQLRPQAGVALAVEDPRTLRRIELGTAIAGQAPDGWMDWLAAFVDYPWRAFTWLGPGHTLPCDAVPGFEAALLLRDPLDAPSVGFPDHRGDPVTPLWAIPITQAERTLAEEEGSGALAERLAAAGHTFVHRPRRSVV